MVLRFTCVIHNHLMCWCCRLCVIRHEKPVITASPAKYLCLLHAAERRRRCCRSICHWCARTDKWLPFCAHKLEEKKRRPPPPPLLFFFSHPSFQLKHSSMPTRQKQTCKHSHTLRQQMDSRCSASKSICSIECEEEVDLQGKLLPRLHLLVLSKFRGWRLREQNEYRLSELQKPSCDANRLYEERRRSPCELISINQDRSQNCGFGNIIFVFAFNHWFLFSAFAV